MNKAGWIGALVLFASACASGANDPVPTTGATPQTARNGAIAFIRIDPDDVSGDGTIPPSSLVIIEPGLGERVIAEASRARPSWSPDGSTLAYSGTGGIWTVEPGRKPRRVTRCVAPTCVGDGPPAWSPDARTLAFASDRLGSEGLWTVSASGDEPAVLAGDLSIRGAPSFSPDGATIAIVATPAAGEPEIVLLDATSGAVRATLAPPGVRFGASVMWSPDGSQLVVTAVVDGQVDGREAVYLMGIDGSYLKLLTSCGGSACIDVWPAWSPDGKRIVFTRGRCDDPGSDCYSGDLYVIPAEGGSSTQLTEGAPLDCCAAWQPVT